MLVSVLFACNIRYKKTHYIAGSLTFKSLSLTMKCGKLCFENDTNDVNPWKAMLLIHHPGIEFFRLMVEYLRLILVLKQLLRFEMQPG